MALTDKLTDIADAIRRKTGGTAKLSLTEMVTEIDSISAGGGAEEAPEVSLVNASTDGWATGIAVYYRYYDHYDEDWYDTFEFYGLDEYTDAQFSAYVGAFVFVPTLSDGSGYTTIDGGTYIGKVGNVDIFSINSTECTIWDGYY